VRPLASRSWMTSDRSWVRIRAEQGTGELVELGVGSVPGRPRTARPGACPSTRWTTGVAVTAGGAAEPSPRDAWTDGDGAGGRRGRDDPVDRRGRRCARCRLRSRDHRPGERERGLPLPGGAGLGIEAVAAGTGERTSGGEALQAGRGSCGRSRGRLDRCRSGGCALAAAPDPASRGGNTISRGPPGRFRDGGAGNRCAGDRRELDRDRRPGRHGPRAGRRRWPGGRRARPSGRRRGSGPPAPGSRVPRRARGLRAARSDMMITFLDLGVRRHTGDENNATCTDITDCLLQY